MLVVRVNRGATQRSTGSVQGESFHSVLCAFLRLIRMRSLDPDFLIFLGLWIWWSRSRFRSEDIWEVFPLTFAYLAHSTSPTLQVEINIVSRSSFHCSKNKCQLHLFISWCVPLFHKICFGNPQQTLPRKLQKTETSSKVRKDIPRIIVFKIRSRSISESCVKRRSSKTLLDENM